MCAMARECRSSATTSPQVITSTSRAALAWVAALAAATAAAAPLRLHVPSPDWRDQVIYFVVTDRFADGDPRNNDLGAGEFRAGSPRHYNGGDLKGLVGRLDYIRGLGATALWITPPVANLWLDGAADYSGYHGYWAEHFGRVDRHLGTLADYRELSHALHSNGMLLVQDIVLNHTGNFFGYADGWDAADPARSWRRNAGARPQGRPSQHPFDRNDPRDLQQRRAGIYHWTPDITDYADAEQEANWQMAGLDDLNTENPLVRRVLRQTYARWIRDVGVDAFRVDTAFYVPPAFFADFVHGRHGIAHAARATGRRDFLVFGEGFALDKPFDDTNARRIGRYLQGDDGRPLMDGMLNFPLYGAFGDVFARGRPTAELAHRIAATMRLYTRPHRMVNFVDNHDVDRFLAGGSEAGLKQALLAMLTLPGIPAVYYGTEQGFTEQRQAMFAAGYASGGRDRYDRAAPLYREIAAMTALRRGHRVFSRGAPTVLADNAAGPGVIAWRMDHEGEQALVALNTAEQPALLDNLELGAGGVLEPLYGLHGRPPALAAGADGRLHLTLPARGGSVWRLRAAAAAAPAPAAAVMLDPGPEAVAGDFVASGRARGIERLRVVVDGALDRAAVVTPDAEGRWQARIDTGAMADASQQHRVVAWDEASGAASAAARFRVRPAWRTLVELDDPALDDRGPNGRYAYPPGPGYADARPADIRRVRVAGAGGALRVELTMASLVTLWKPPNGFDHVAFTIFVELPGLPGGSTLMPLQNAGLPAGMRWQRRLRAHGWSNALFGAEGADAAHEGRPVAPAAAIEVDRERSSIAFVLPAASLGNPASLSGARIYVTTWDYDGGYRALLPAPQGVAFTGGDANDPKLMDDTAVIVVP
jgi:glycosidase